MMRTFIVQENGLVFAGMGMEEPMRINRIGERGVAMPPAQQKGMLPPVVRYLSTSDRLLVFERPPFWTTITFSGVRAPRVTEDHVIEQKYTLPVPWTVYLVRFNATQVHEVSLWAIDKPLTSRHDPPRYGALPLPNYYFEGNFCLPTTDYARYTDLSEMVNLAFSAVWESHFNMDAAPMGERYYAEWYEYREQERLDTNPFLRAIHPRDVEDNSMAGLLHAWSKLSMEDALKFPWVPSDGQVHVLFDDTYTKRSYFTQFHQMVSGHF